MGNYRNTSLYDSLDAVGIFHTSLKFHSLTICFLDNPAGIHNGIIHRALIRHERHIDSHESVLRASANSLSMMNHIVNGNSKGILITQHHVTQRIANENHINPRFINCASCMIVVCGKHAYRLNAFTTKHIRYRFLHFFEKINKKNLK